MNYKKANRLSGIFFCLAIALAVLLFCFDDVNAGFRTIVVLSLLALIVGFGIKIKFFRCPHCHKILPFRTFSLPCYCPNCGEKLEP